MIKIELKKNSPVGLVYHLVGLLELDGLLYLAVFEYYGALLGRGVCIYGERCCEMELDSFLGLLVLCLLGADGFCNADDRRYGADYEEAETRECHDVNVGATECTIVCLGNCICTICGVSTAKHSFVYGKIRVLTGI